MPRSPHPLVLVVDDDRDTRELYRVVFEMAGFTVESAESVHEAARVARACQPLVGLCDWRLPDGTGPEVAAALRAVHPSLVLVALIGVTFGRGEEQEAADAGFDDVLRKPI